MLCTIELAKISRFIPLLVLGMINPGRKEGELSKEDESESLQSEEEEKES